MAINWGLAQGNGFQNALATGMQMGAQARQAKERKEYRNALAQFAIDPNEANTAAVAPYAPELVIQQRAQQAQAQDRQQEQRRADLPMLGKLLNHAAQGPEQWNQAVGIAQQYGIDVSGLPQQFDPEWAKSRATMIGALTTPEGQEIMSTAGKQAYDEGLRPGDGRFETRVKEIWQQNGALPYTDSSGATRLYIPGRGQPTQQPVAEGTVVENDAGERMVLRNGRWEPMTTGGTGNNVGPNFLDGLQPR